MPKDQTDKQAGNIVLKNVRLAFGQGLFEKQTANGGEGKAAFSSSFIIAPEDKANLALLKKAIRDAALRKWSKKAEAVLKELERKDRTCLHDGDDKSQYDGFEGNMYVSTRSDTRPSAFDNDKDKTPLTKEDGKIYSGCYVDASINIWGQDNKFGKRINAQIRGVRFRKDGDSFSGGGSADESDFDDLSDGADADDIEEDDLF